MFRQMPIFVLVVALSPVLFSLSNGNSKAYLANGTAPPTPIPTASLLLTPSPTAFLADDESTPQPCLPGVGTPKIAPAEAVDALFNRLDTAPLLDFFNSGGTVKTLRADLNNAGNEVGPYLAQVVEHDITGDAIPEIFLAVTAGLISASNGQTHVLMFQCVDEAYQAMTLFRRAGAGILSEGLYTGGGAHILAIADLNANDAPDVVIVVGWSSEIIDHAEYYVLEWQADTFHSLIEYQDFMDETVYYLTGDNTGSFVLSDPDEDGIYDLLIDAAGYHWNGELYLPDEDVE